MVEYYLKDWMHKNVAFAAENETVMEAANEMVDKKIGSLIVVKDKKHHEPLGIVTESDFVRKVVASGVSSKLITISDIMSKGVISIDKTKTLLEASELMNQKNKKHLVVMDGEKVVGVITSTNIIQALVKASH